MKKQHALLLLIFSIFIFGCKKYDDGPGLSFLSVTERLTGTWDVKKWEGGGFDAFDIYDEIEMEFGSDGDWQGEYAVFGGGSDDVYGNWSFDEDKSHILIEVNNYEYEWEIKRLTNKELWFETEDNEEVECTKK